MFIVRLKETIDSSFLKVEISGNGVSHTYVLYLATATPSSELAKALPSPHSLYPE